MKQPKTRNPTSSTASISPRPWVSPVLQPSLLWGVCQQFVLTGLLLSLAHQPHHRKPLGSQQHWQSNPDTGSGSFRESHVPAHGWGGRWCGHAGGGGAAEPQRGSDGWDGAAVLWVQQQALLLLWLRHLWGTHQGKAGALCLSFLPSSYTFAYQGSQDAGREKFLANHWANKISPQHSRSTLWLLPVFQLWSACHAPADIAQPVRLVIDSPEIKSPHPSPSFP